jgi:hypothetical protein
MSERHPLKRKSVKPSSSTVRGMLPSKQFQSLDASMQSLRAVGLRFEWVWAGVSHGWVSAGMIDDRVMCEILASESPIIGRISLSKEEILTLKGSDAFPVRFKPFLDFSVEEKRGKVIFELELDTTAKRDVFSEIVRCLELALLIEPVEAEEA